MNHNRSITLSAVTFALLLFASAEIFAQALPGPPPPTAPAKETKLLPQQSTGQDPATAMAARVNGTPILQSELDRTLDQLTHNQKISPEALPTVQATILQQLIDRTLIKQFLAAQIFSASNEEINAALQQLRGTLQKQNVNLDDFLARTHQTEAMLRANMNYELSWQKFLTKNTTDEALEALFKRFHEQFDGTERRVSHILFRPVGNPDQAAVKALIDQADQIRDQINTGIVTFEAAAEKYSAGPSRTRGGDLGFIPVKGVMAESFSQAAFNLKPGDVSTPVVSPFGVHLIKVTDTKPGTKTWQDVREQLQPALADFIQKKILQEAKEKAVIEYAATAPHFKPGTTELETPPSAAN